MKNFSSLNRIFWLALVLGLSLYPFGLNARKPYWTSPYNITWTAPSANASQSMPLGASISDVTSGWKTAICSFTSNAADVSAKTGNISNWGMYVYVCPPIPFPDTVGVDRPSTCMMVRLPFRLAIPLGWVKNIGVHFKLHASGNTAVEIDYRNGRIQKQEVLPKTRMKDVVTILQ